MYLCVCKYLHFHINLLHLLLFSIGLVRVHSSMMPLGRTGKKFQFSISCYYPYLSLHFALLSPERQANALHNDSQQYYIYVCMCLLWKYVNNMHLYCEIDRKIARFLHWRDEATVCRKDYRWAKYEKHFSKAIN